MPRRRGKPADRQARFLTALEELLAAPATDLDEALTHACNHIVEQLGGEKVDAFLYDPATDTLVARGTSETPLGIKQRQHGLDRLPLSNGGRVVQVFRDGEPLIDGRTQQDEQELRGIKEVLNARSQLAVPLEVDGSRRGVLCVISTRANAFSEDDLRFALAIGRWLSAMIHRGELVEAATRAALEEGRRGAAEELIQTFAHDLGNYLLAMRMRLAHLARRALRENRPADKTDLERVSRTVNQMAEVLAELMEVGRLEQGLLRLEAVPFDVAALARESAEALSLPAVAVEVRGPAEVVLAADAKRVRQVLTNLIANAVKHAEPGATVTVNLEVGEASDGERKLKLSVSNPGPPISLELLPHVFEKFRRGPGSSGLGLGLFLARGIARAHRGELKVESTPDQTTFTLELPGVELPEDPEDG